MFNRDEYAISCDYMQEMEIAHLRRGCVWRADLPWGTSDRPAGALLSDMVTLAQEHDAACATAVEGAS